MFVAVLIRILSSGKDLSELSLCHACFVLVIL